ncbi:MAG: phosphatidylinositol mannoside acyltransferase [Actinomycetota bacterium]|nr:phosphatidylinositol mannoside acyltransferase [Actinomycetota bacterium]
MIEPEVAAEVDEPRRSRATSELLTSFQMRAMEWLGMRLPRPVGLTLAAAYHRVFFATADRQREVVARNLSRVLGHPPDSPIVQAATRECFALYARYWYETFAVRTMPWEEVDRRFSIDGLEHVDRAMEAGRGIIIAAPHMGNWDAGAHWLCTRGYKLAAVAEELKPPEVFDLFFRHRRALGLTIVPLSEGKRVGERLVGLLAENYLIALVADRDLTGRGVDVEMFGATRKLPAGPARLALGTGAPLSVAAAFTTRDGGHCRILPPLEFEPTGDMRSDVTTLTRMIAAAFERFISEAPADWHMFQPAWDEESGEAATTPAPP